MKLKDFQNKVISCGFVLILTCVGIITIIKEDQKISKIENRNLSTFADLKNSNYLNTTFQNVLEDSLSDQFLNRYSFVNLKKSLDYSFMNMAYIGSDFDYVLRPLSDSGVYQIGNSRYMIDEPLKYSEQSNARVKDKANQINALQERNPDVKVHVYLPVSNHETDMFDETNELKSAGPLYRETMQATLTVPYQEFAAKDVNEIHEYFFSSDHHMNNKGTYRMYADILSMIYPTEAPKKPSFEDCHVGQTFYGTFSSRTGYILDADMYCVYNYDLPAYDVIYDGEKMIPNTPKDFLAYQKATDDKPYYYDISTEVYEPLSYYDTHQQEKENLLIVGDSLTRSFIDVLASSYNKTYRLIPYDYYKIHGESFDYDKFIEDNDIDSVVFCYGLVNYYYQDHWGDRFIETTIPIPTERGE